LVRNSDVCPLSLLKNAKVVAVDGAAYATAGKRSLYENLRFSAEDAHLAVVRSGKATHIEVSLAKI